MGGTDRFIRDSSAWPSGAVERLLQRLREGSTDSWPVGMDILGCDMHSPGPKGKCGVVDEGRYDEPTHIF